MIDDPLTWDLDQVPFEVREDMGPLRVWKGLLLLREFAWHHHGHVDQEAGLHILDVRAGRWVAHYPPGGYDEVSRRPVPSRLTRVQE